VANPAGTILGQGEWGDPSRCAPADDALIWNRRPVDRGDRYNPGIPAARGHI